MILSLPLKMEGQGENSPKSSRIEPLNSPAWASDKTQGMFLPLRVGGVGGADGGRAGEGCLFTIIGFMRRRPAPPASSRLPPSQPALFRGAGQKRFFYPCPSVVPNELSRRISKNAACADHQVSRHWRTVSRSWLDRHGFWMKCCASCGESSWPAMSGL